MRSSTRGSADVRSSTMASKTILSAEGRLGGRGLLRSPRRMLDRFRRDSKGTESPENRTPSRTPEATTASDALSLLYADLNATTDNDLVTIQTPAG